MKNPSLSSSQTSKGLGGFATGLGSTVNVSSARNSQPEELTTVICSI